jgi:ABC-type lipopolysaccharide export system ATPase subunit
MLKPLYSQQNTVYLPQHHHAPDHLKIKTLFQLLQLDWKEFLSLFESFSPYCNSKLNQIYGGECRVIETYAVLKQASDIILLDEPFSNIAPLHVETIKQLIIAEKAQKAIIITDHYYREVIDIYDELYLLQNGCTNKIENLEELEDYKYLNLGSL